MFKRNSLRKYFTLILMFFTVVIGFSSWIIVGEKNVNLGKVPSTRGVAYINSDTSTLYTSIEGALSKAVSGDVVHVVLNTTDPAVINYDCEVKSGVTLNISYEQGYLQEENSNGIVEAILTYSDPTDEDDGNANTDPAYAGISALNLKNVVKVNDGVTITNNGTIVVSGELSGSGGGQAYCGQTARNYAKLVMGSNSVINNYGSIRCCGFIEESSNNNGSIIVNNSNSTLRMPFVLKDFRGGNTSYALYKVISEKECSPFNQFEVNNVQCKIRVNYGGTLSCYANISAASSIHKSLIGMIGNNDSYFISLYNSKKSDYDKYYAEIKFDKTTNVCAYNLYGGATINKISIRLKPSSLTGEIDMSTENVYFPISWRMNLTMNKYEGQEGKATFNSQNQKLKLMTGASLIVNKGCEFLSSSMIVYSFFRDRGNVSSSNIGGTTYENKNPAIFKVYGDYSYTGSFGGLIIKGDGASILPEGDSSLEKYEALNQDGLLTKDITEWTIISEVKKIVTETEFNNKKRVTIGVIKTDKWGTPTYQVSGGYTLSSSTSHNVNFFLSSGSTFTPKLLTNILTATYNGSYYVKGSQLSVTSTSTFIIKATSSTIGSVDTSSVTITGGTEVAVGSTLQLNAKSYNSDGNITYTTRFTWSSSDTSLATVNSNGLVTGVSMGKVVITAISLDDNSISGKYTIDVTDPSLIVSISLSADKTSGNKNTAYDSNITLTINPSTASGYTVSWSVSDTSRASITSQSNSSAKVNVKAAGKFTNTVKINVTVTCKSGKKFTTSVELTAKGSWF